MNMKIKLNENYKNLKKSYLFSEIAKRVKAYGAENPDKKSYGSASATSRFR